MTAPVSESSPRDTPIVPQLAPPKDPGEVQEVLWEKMKVRAGTSPTTWRDLAPDQRISREGFRPLVAREASLNPLTTASPPEGMEALLEAAEQYQLTLKEGSAPPEALLQQLDELEAKLHALQGNNDALEELSILISYIRLEKAALRFRLPLTVEKEISPRLPPTMGGKPAPARTQRSPSLSSRKLSAGAGGEEDGADGESSPALGPPPVSPSGGTK